MSCGGSSGCKSPTAELSRLTPVAVPSELEPQADRPEIDVAVAARPIGDAIAFPFAAHAEVVGELVTHTQAELVVPIVVLVAGGDRAHRCGEIRARRHLG